MAQDTDQVKFQKEIIETLSAQAVTLARVEERLNSLITTVRDMQAMIQATYATKEELQTIKETANGNRVTLKAEYVTKNEFDPVRRVVYGAVTFILLAVLGAIIALVVLSS